MLSEASYLSRVWLGTKVSPRLLPSVAKPLSAHLKLTENCQAKCISCDYWKTRWHDALDTERAVNVINQVGDCGIHSLRLTGGEPLLRRDLFEILDKANTAPFKSIVIQTNGLLIKKLHKEINASPITKVAVSIDGLKETNDQIRGIRGYFDLGMEGIRLLRNKRVAISVTLNRLSSSELETLAEVARSLGAQIEFNILSRSLYFLNGADMDHMWPEQRDVAIIERFLKDTLKRPAYEVDYIRRYYSHEEPAEPPCVLGFTQVFILSNGDVLTGCYPLKPVGNILRERLEAILASEAYMQQAAAMVRRECPGCTCGVETSLAMKHGASSGLFQLRRLGSRPGGQPQVPAVGTAQAENTSGT
ncbi:MAG TPA: radical SAM protein [Verrucomicrobiae bacterium]|nr:radical SAM protein [Verrucomicrobiae bacterium]